MGIAKSNTDSKNYGARSGTNFSRLGTKSGTDFVNYGRKSGTDFNFLGAAPHETSNVRLTERRKSALSSVSDFAFCKVFEDADKWWLTGGTVTAGDGNAEINDIELGDIGSEPADGTWFWIEVSGDAIIENDVLLPGFNLTSASVGSGATFPASNTIPTVTAEAGTLYVSLGKWSGGAFVPAACGNIYVGHCPGSLTPQRL